MTVFISGGAKNGKSSLAQSLAVKLAAGGRLYYVATMIPTDDEDRARIRRHVADREGLGFVTLERGRRILSCLEEADPDGTFLVDSVTALLMNEMFPPPYDGTVDENAPARCADELVRFVRSVRNAVLVSDGIYSDAALYDGETERYRRGLAAVDRALAGACDTAVEVCAGIPVVHKGGLLP
ncbi:MAG: bifunctional adenosylcobinamide kinase/adenosylcobinamide-phosphate guanylyltransferase [Oscillospiraceae bacterium]|nr:bifunctional adenosylcobinamide kinase/adenosylcobinamide-phosphate guanylyltransferase [Oscillospiraceae bacterium]